MKAHKAEAYPQFPWDKTPDHWFEPAIFRLLA